MADELDRQWVHLQHKHIIAVSAAAQQLLVSVRDVLLIEFWQSGPSQIAIITLYLYSEV
jgi:hypothetical protein